MILLDFNSLFSVYSGIVLEIGDLLESGMIAKILKFDSSIPYANVQEDSGLVLFNLLQFILFFCCYLLLSLIILLIGLSSLKRINNISCSYCCFRGWSWSYFQGNI
jgi:uncharacterized membrane protein required for colicin V production